MKFVQESRKIWPIFSNPTVNSNKNHIQQTFYLQQKNHYNFYSTVTDLWQCQSNINDRHMHPPLLSPNFVSFAPSCHVYIPFAKNIGQNIINTLFSDLNYHCLFCISRPWASILAHPVQVKFLLGICYIFYYNNPFTNTIIIIVVVNVTLIWPWYRLFIK